MVVNQKVSIDRIRETELLLFMFTLGKGGGGGGVWFEHSLSLYTHWRYKLSEIPIPYQIDLKEIATIVKPPLMTTFFDSSGGPIIFLLISFHGVACQRANNMLNTKSDSRYHSGNFSKGKEILLCESELWTSWLQHFPYVRICLLLSYL